MTRATQTLEAVGLTKKYGSFKALDSLNLKIEGPKCVGFLGPNGAGKTTTLKIFTGLIRPSAGKALVNGVDVHAQKRKALATVAALVETPEIYSSLTPNEALMMIAKFRGVPPEIRRKKVEDALHEVRMEEWCDKKVGEFSKGMKQRVNIASTLLNDPEVVLLDEPSSGLDPRGMSEVREIIRGLKDRKRLIFMSSHLLSEVMEVCDEAALVDHGKLLAYDTIQRLTERFSVGGVLEAGFLRPVSAEVLKSVESIRGVISAERIDEKSLRLKFSGGPDAQAMIYSELDSLKIGVNSLRSTSSALEDVYLNLVKENV
jgi:ABC-2 type transport system ATP-binding protein